jgi:hypothetical protein
MALSKRMGMDEEHRRWSSNDRGPIALCLLARSISGKKKRHLTSPIEVQLAG